MCALKKVVTGRFQRYSTYKKFQEAQVNEENRWFYGEEKEI